MSEQEDETAVERATARVRGAVLTAADPGFDEARRVWNDKVDTQPFAIIKCTGPADVIEGLDLAETLDRQVSVKCGGHQTSGDAILEDGIVLDLSPMNAVRVDPQRQTVRVGGGATWGDVYHETVPFGLVPPGGFDDGVGVGGFTLGGGQGVVVRTEGMACDCLREVDIVTADGRLLTASEEEHPDLFWALRGGGSVGFGVVTSFVFDCFSLPFEVATATAYYSLSDGPAVFRTFRDHMEDIPDEVVPTIGILTLPELPGIPKADVGSLGVYLYLLYVGDTAGADAAFAPLLESVDPLTVHRAEIPITETFGPSPSGVRRQWESLYLEDITDDLIETIFEEIPPFPTPESTIALFGFGDLTNRYGPADTAYAHRESPYQLMIGVDWEDPDDDKSNRDWALETHATLTDHGSGEYVNLQTATDRDRAKAAFGDNLARLKKIKAEWDPENRFDTGPSLVADQ